MSKYYWDSVRGIEIERPTSLPGGIANPSDATLADHGIYPLVIAPPYNVPAGHEVTLYDVFISDGMAIKTPRIAPIADRLAREAAGAQAQAVADAHDYAAALGAIALLAQAVATIEAGDTLQTVTVKTLAASAAARDSGALDDAQRLSDLSVAALAAWGELRAVGIMGARLWRALQALTPPPA